MTTTIARSAAIAVGAWLAVMTGANAFAAESPLGVWIDDTGRGAVEIAPCGDKLCGKLVWLKDSKNAGACGTPILGDVPKNGDGGWIYSPEEKAKYDVELTADGSDKLTVLGYVGTKLFSQEMTWTRAPSDLQRCDVREAKAAPQPDAPPQTPVPAERSASAEPLPNGSRAADKRMPQAAGTQTAQADIAPAAKPAAARAPKAKPRRKMCRVDAPFVRVEFPCDDD